MVTICNSSDEMQLQISIEKWWVGYFVLEFTYIRLNVD
jgi:hypothetical protein